MNFLPLSRLLSEGRDDHWPVASVGGREVGFATFRNDVISNAQRLAEIGYQRGLIAAKDSYWAAVGVLALHYAKALAILPSSFQPGALAQCKADVVISEDAGGKLVRTGTQVYLLTPSGRAFNRPDELDPELSRLELFTAGSTGHPKRIEKTLLEMEIEAQAIEAALGLHLHEAPVFATIPHHHLYGLSFKLAWPLCTGRRFIGRTYEFWGSLAADLIPNAILVTSPAHLTRIPPITELKNRKLGLVLSAGAELPEDAATQAMLALARPVTDILGSTETGVIAYRHRIRAEATWRTFPGVRIKQLADGRMAVQSNHVGQTAAMDDWHESADSIELEPEGSFRLKGRADRVVKIEGYRVSLSNLEANLCDSDLVHEAAVVSLGTKPPCLGAVVVLTLKGKQTLESLGHFRLGRSLRQDLAQWMAPSSLPRYWRFVDHLPVAALGKRREADLALLFMSARDDVQEPELRSVRRSDLSVELDLFIPRDLVQLRGHFPGLPIVPGVAQVDWAVKLAAKYFDLAIDVAKTFQIKFRRVTTAPSEVTLKLSYRPQQRQVAFEYVQDDAILSSGTFALDP
jgi:3-hydroxymyristoyl/3-hydroxydecanoyl-(acyl carrier protein) dehydratase